MDSYIYETVKKQLEKELAQCDGDYLREKIKGKLVKLKEDYEDKK